MARDVHNLWPPADYDASEHDQTGYYARQEKHRAEMWPYVTACIVGMVAIVVVVSLYQAVT